MDKRSTSFIPELWGGIECSYNRVGNRYMDQLDYAGHYHRIEKDIVSIASLGIRVMRYPVIWERLQPTKEARVDFSLVAQPLELLRQHGIEPIAGLVHHGSGPTYADFTTSGFADGLSAYAGKVAAQFSWIKYYTPVNEPLTTARFAGLYGLWFPHHRNDRSFVNILLNELKATVLAMKAIRRVNPEAKLVQTEDLAKIYSTPLLQYQAKFENERRWLTFDILCGRLKPGHFLWDYFRHYVKNERELYFFVENPCPPDIIGFDYYATSERYLDENLSRYPAHTHGRNHKHRYADVEAVRVRINEPHGVGVLLKEAWDRFKLPMALTEVHINCDPDNQIRWFGKIRQTCTELRQQGVELLAMTTWAMLGSFGWNKLLTHPHGDYESGAFDVSSGYARLTPIGEYIQMLSRNPNYHHPAIEQPGWWEQDSRLLFDQYQPEALEEVQAPDGKEDCI